MRILHIITGLSDGGAEAVLYRLCVRDQEDEHVVVSLMGPGKYGPLLEAEGIRVRCLNVRPHPMILGALLRLWLIIRAESPEVVQTWMYHADFFGGMIARLAGCKRVYWGIHNTTLMPGRSKRSTIWIVRLNAMLSRWVPKGIIYCAEKARQVHRDLGYDGRREVVIPNGYDVAVFRPDATVRKALRRVFGVDEQTPIIGLVARLDPQKDHDNLFAALTILQRQGCDFRCVLVGSAMTADNAALLSKLSAHGLEDSKTIVLLGRREDVPNIMNALDVHVLPSVAEAFPNVLCEAMACGTPCVTTDVGDAAFIVGSTGWVVPPGQPEALAQAIMSALHARHCSGWLERQHLARQRIVDNFDIGRMTSLYRQQWGFK